MNTPVELQTEPKFIQQYRENCRRILSGQQPQKFVVYQPNELSGWGNKLRAVSAAFLLALLTNRLLLIDYSLFLECFEPPEGVSWQFSNYRFLQNKTVSKFYLDTRFRPEHLDILATQDLDVAFPETCIFHVQGVAFDEAIAANPHYQSQLNELFGHAASRMSRTGQIMPFLLQNPNPHFLAQVNRRKAELELVSYPEALVSVQFRSFFDIGSPNLQYFDRFTTEMCAKIETELQTLQQTRGLRFFVTSDRLDVTQNLASILKNYGTVTYVNQPIVHSGELGWFNKILDKGMRVLLRTDAPGQFKIDGYQFVPRRLRKRPEYSALTDWYILGESEVLISTLTSYAAFAMARTGHQALIVKIGWESDFAGIVTDQEYATSF